MIYFGRLRRWFLAGVCAIVLLGAMVSHAQNARVSVHLDKSVNVLTPVSFGLPAILFDAGSFSSAAVPYTRLAGATTLRYPGTLGVPDLYHWSTGTLTKYVGGEAPYINPDSNFGRFASNLDRFGSALIVVNYGASLDGTGGGDLGEAAAWVAYANGDPSDAKPVPRDKNGDDWHTIGFWATIRGQAPLASDDGFNFLRIAHLRPFGIELWQVGDHVYNNGFYGGKHVGTADLHGPAPTKLNDYGKLEKNPALSPSAYGSRVAEFTRAMKTVDPAIKVGASLAVVEGSSADADWNAKMWAVDWNEKTLKTACAAIDFVALDWQQSPLLPPDWKTLDEASLLQNTRSAIAGVLNESIREDKADCPAGHMPRIAFEPAAVASWPHQEHPVAVALWVADSYALLAETGAQNVSWYELHGDSMLSADNKSYGPAFMGMEMLHIVAHNPGDQFVEASSNASQLAVHAVRRRDGVIGLMLVNENPKGAVTATIELSGAAVGSKGKRFDYGAAQLKSGAALVPAEVDGLGEKFTITVPAYTITDLLIPPAK
ncbi:hypothetical protein ACOBR2_18795 [Telmatobacter bradus]|uniref:hypothetical protein n=1 Tax=Telmatobacter bradus TaxID=474953 RepID=UPI003B430357